jgi:hypothetical protein
LPCWARGLGGGIHLSSWMLAQLIA